MRCGWRLRVRARADQSAFNRYRAVPEAFDIHPGGERALRVLAQHQQFIGPSDTDQCRVGDALLKYRTPGTKNGAVPLPRLDTAGPPTDKTGAMFVCYFKAAHTGRLPIRPEPSRLSLAHRPCAPSFVQQMRKAGKCRHHFLQRKCRFMTQSGLGLVHRKVGVSCHHSAPWPPNNRCCAK
jgi:hypothetical protein